jgi:D-sedoheptulose 7-phosphate isomerase
MEPSPHVRVISSAPMLEQRLQQPFFDSADLLYAAAELLAKPLADAVNAVVGSITSGGKVLACGEGASALAAQHLAAALVGGFERERPALAALALSADASIHLGLTGGSPASPFVTQITTLGQPGDVLVLLTAHTEMSVVAFTGRQPGVLREHLLETDVLVSVPHERPARIHELHLLSLHALCDAVDLQLLGEEDTP